MHETWKYRMTEWILAFAIVMILGCCSCSTVGCKEQWLKHLSDDSNKARAEFLLHFPLGANMTRTKDELMKNGYKVTCDVTNRSTQQRYMCLGATIGEGLLSYKFRSIALYYDDKNALTNITTCTHTVKSWDPSTY